MRGFTRSSDDPPRGKVRPYPGVVHRPRPDSESTRDWELALCGDLTDKQVELTERLVRMEGHADEIHAAGLKRLFREHGEANPTRFLIARELFRHLERVTDSFEDVANEIDGLVIDHA